MPAVGRLSVSRLYSCAQALYRLHDFGIHFGRLNVADGRPDGSLLDNSGYSRQYNLPPAC
jgi:hypothetical protein